MENGIIKRKDKVYSLKPFVFQYIDAITEDDEIIRGGGIYFLDKHILTIAHCNNLWIDEEGKPYNFRVSDNILFLRKFAISVSSKKNTRR